MLSVGSFIRNYKFVSEMKQGAQGIVFVVEDSKTNKQYVLKSVLIEESVRDDFEKMITAWKTLCKSEEKDFIVEFVEHFYEGRNAIIIMEFCVGGDLETLIEKRFAEHKNFTELEVMKVLVEGMKILKAMHFLKFIHRDIKSANILVGADGKYKISDFNTSKILEGKTTSSTMAGTLEFTSPEIVNSEEYSFPTDVFSMGAVLYQMMVGKTPFVGVRGVVLKDLMLGKYTPIGTELGYTQDLVNLVHACLSLDPSARPTPAQVLAMPCVAHAEDALRRDTLARSDARIAALERDVRETSERCARAEELCGAAEKKAEEAKSEAACAKREANSAKREAADAKREAADAKKEAADAKREATAARREAREAQEQCTTAEEEATTARKEAQEAKKGSQHAQASAAQMQEQVRRLWEEVEALRREQQQQIRPASSEGGGSGLFRSSGGVSKFGSGGGGGILGTIKKGLF